MCMPGHLCVCVCVCVCEIMWYIEVDDHFFIKTVSWDNVEPTQ